MFVKYTLPAHWAPALINADESGLSDDEVSALDGFIGWMTEHHKVDDKHGSAYCVGCSEEPEFVRHHDATDWCLPCDCLHFTFQV